LSTTQEPLKRKKRKPIDWSTAGIGSVVAAAAVLVYVRDGRARFFEVLYDDLSLFGSMLPKVLAGCLIGAFVARLLPREMVSRWIGAESGFLGLIIGTVVGAFLPGGPITIFPVASAFWAIGADVGATIAFVTSWTLLGYTRALVWELPLFGPDFVIWRIIVALPLPIIAGILGRLLATMVKAKIDKPETASEAAAVIADPPKVETFTPEFVDIAAAHPAVARDDAAATPYARQDDSHDDSHPGDRP
jgi:uncharacterized membrane protein YraQ (UPF0718 family)